MTKWFKDVADAKDYYNRLIVDANNKVDRIKELTDMIKRLTSTLEGIVEADQLKNHDLSSEAISQIQIAINDAKVIISKNLNEQ